MKAVTRKILQGLFLAGVLSSPDHSGENGFTIKATDVREQPFFDAKPVVTLPEKTVVEILLRQGGWMQVKTADAEALRQDMVEGLARRGELDERWRGAFLEVPRHAFIPELVWRHDREVGGSCDLVPVRRCDDPQYWLAAAYANAPVNTQVDDGHPTGEAGCGFEVTSSASMPAVVAQMLAALDAEPGMRVLEIGTGTGYNAALLSHRLGADRGAARRGRGPARARRPCMRPAAPRGRASSRCADTH